MINIRLGIGYDVHKFVSGRKLILGGIEIPSEAGLDGHSDADVLLHSICDALLGAASLGDIGKHFPNTDERFKDISSLILLEKVNELIASQNYLIGNIDSTILAEKPKLLPYIDIMRGKIATTLKINPDQISIKATTNEKMGFVGRQEGIAAISVALLYRKKR
ncbi:MAG: 2-C-methyl-D-erythritol 2,4-cyclodiphosphate synthase [Ignavibacteria bacterium]|jgi:2-C-methyl-D-erythritol 2,4-cyclodiphosphate synthase|nr:2-C-methyl-D-erythritol 2,4-cyclodiphosphate synthase [Ignavibacteria bacterium]MDH7528663.1 2-C-methyl-D-erythritol 2,4-cyclodiphosphate synthase [Ignavibacteria bacterium]NPV11134.1 2-C-methyl-D-erythritol 2,4-cyclodiphosphate synthase [Ignavibacteria bacterium]